jgi:hypothetical protein
MTQPVQAPEQPDKYSDDNQQRPEIVPDDRDHDQEREGLPGFQA